MKIEYDVVRSDRKTVAIVISADNKITVRCPKRTSETKIKSFVESKSGWIEKVIALNGKKIVLNGDILSYERVFVNGVKFPLVVGSKTQITSDCVYAKNLKQIKNAFVSEFWGDFKKSVENTAFKFNCNVDGFDIKSYKRRWGCCFRNGKINFNWMIFMLPEDIRRYVVFHELCHTVHFNHSKDFWGLVEKYVPDYKILRARLKTFDFITKLY